MGVRELRVSDLLAVHASYSNQTYRHYKHFSSTTVMLSILPLPIINPTDAASPLIPTPTPVTTITLTL